MNNLEQAIQAIEYGLPKVTRGGQRPAKKVGLGKRMAQYKVPGVNIAFIDREKLVWTKGFGVMEAGGEKSVTNETIFQAASISKPVTAMVSLHLVEKGLLDLDADANDFLRSWKIPRSKYTQARSDGTHPKVTLRGLLSHTAGMNIRGYTGYTFDRQLPSLQQILNGEPPANSKPVWVMQSPGKDFRYSGGGYLVAQQMIEDVSGRPLAVLAKEIIFDKLGMTNSSFDTKLPEAYIPRAATGHNKTGEPVRGKWHIYPEQAAASLWTTPSDLARLIIETLKSRKNESNLVLSAEMTRQMLIPQISLGGVGFNVIIKDGMTRFGHPGWNVGFHSLMLGCPETGQGIIWMTNVENGRRLGWEVSRGLAEVVK